MTFPEFIKRRKRSRQALLSWCSSSTEPGSEGRWSARMVYHHVLLAESGALSLLERLVEKAGTLPEVAIEGPMPVREELFSFDLVRAMSVPAARGTEPDPDVLDSELRELETSTEERYASLLELGKKRDLRSVSFPHPLAGRMNFYEWLAFGLVHEELHLGQAGQGGRLGS